MTDPLTPHQRSERMARVRYRGNRSTEGAVERVLFTEGIAGWEKHPRDILGRPDFFFREYSLAIFVDGCFWHACPKCARRMPHSRTEFWGRKIDENRKRDSRTSRFLRRHGYHVMRIWEHDVRRRDWLSRLRRMIWRIASPADDYPGIGDEASSDDADAATVA